jgi:hypothetical protein
MNKKSELPSTKNINLKEYFRKVTKRQLNNLKRPKDIPVTAHDCGWNHGQAKEK